MTNPCAEVSPVCAVPGCEEPGTTRVKGRAEMPGVEGLIEVSASICDTHRTVVLNGGVQEYSVGFGGPA